MSTRVRQALQGVAGAAGGEALNVEEVFSTYLYDGTGANKTINNGIDLDGEGGMVWIATRSNAEDLSMFDSVQSSVTHCVRSNNPDSSSDRVNSLTSFNSNGFSLGSQGEVNENNYTFASWSFRRASRFFDCVTYTGDGSSNRSVSHNLGSTPGCIIIKRTDASQDWFVAARNNSGSYYYDLNLNTTDTAQGPFDFVGSASYTMDASAFALDIDGVSNYTNISGATYIAYLFAHNDGDGEFGPDGDQDIIKCGSYTGNGSSNGPEIDLGFEPQWLMIKGATIAKEWRIHDVMRGMPVGGSGAFLQANSKSAEGTDSGPVALLPNGFQLTQGGSETNNNNDTYIYIAIRRGPMAVPESATDVFAIDTRGTTGPAFNAGFPIDAALYSITNISYDKILSSRLTGNKVLKTNSTSAESEFSSFNYDYQEGYHDTTSANTNIYSWMWRRAPNYFDVVAYTGDGNSTQDINHNLGVSPEMIWVKNRDSGSVEWVAWHSGEPNKSGYLNSYGAFFQTGVQPYYVGQNVSSTTFRVSADNSAAKTNGNGSNYIAYLFATVAGVSKLGSYTGNGTNQTIDCGFTNGARFVLLRRTDAIGEWQVYDSARGIVTGNDPYLVINNTNAEDAYGATDGIDPQSSGFIINQVSTHNLNVNNASYIFYAIA